MGTVLSCPVFEAMGVYLRLCSPVHTVVPTVLIKMGSAPQIDTSSLASHSHHKPWKQHIYLLPVQNVYVITVNVIRLNEATGARHL